MLSAEERSERARIAAYAMHSRHDSRAIAAHALKSLWAKYYRQVDPENALSPEERHRRARCAMSADISRRRLAEAKAKRNAQDNALAVELLQGGAE